MKCNSVLEVIMQEKTQSHNEHSSAGKSLKNLFSVASER